MQTYSITASGGVKCRGCAFLCITKSFYVSFSVGDVVFVKYKAMHGKLEKIVIKKINTFYNQNVAMANFIDTFNGVWMEPELVGYTEATALLAAYYADLESQYDALPCP